MFTKYPLDIKLELLYGYSIEKLSNILLNINSFDKLIPYCEDIQLIKNISDSQKIMKFLFKIYWIERFGVFTIIYKKNKMTIISDDKDTFENFGLTIKLMPYEKKNTIVTIDFHMNVNNIMINKLMYYNRETVTNNVINNLNSNLNEILGNPSQKLIILQKSIND